MSQPAGLTAFPGYYLAQLAELWVKNYSESRPLTEKDLECVRQAVRVQWQREEDVRLLVKRAGQPAETKQENPQKAAKNQNRQNNSHKPGHGHGHSY